MLTKTWSVWINLVKAFEIGPAPRFRISITFTLQNLIFIVCHRQKTLFTIKCFLHLFSQNYAVIFTCSKRVRVSITDAMQTHLRRSKCCCIVGAISSSWQERISFSCMLFLENIHRAISVARAPHQSISEEEQYFSTIDPFPCYLLNILLHGKRDSGTRVHAHNNNLYCHIFIILKNIICFHNSSFTSTVIKCTPAPSSTSFT